MKVVHKFMPHGDFQSPKDIGQSEYDYFHSTACGYIREFVTKSDDAVTCFYCLRSESMKHYHQINNTLTDSQGCF
jgi:hypothetical protein